MERNFPNETIKTMSTGTHHLFWLVGCEGIGFTSIRRYADCMNRNWHLNLPETDVEIYVKDLAPALLVTASDTTFSNMTKKVQISF